MLRKKELFGHIAALFTMIVWGSTFVSTKVLLGEFGPVEILFFRFLLGYFFLWILRPKKLKVGDRRTELLFGAAGLTGIALNYLCENAALLYTRAANVSVIVSASPFLVGILARIIFKQKLNRYFGIGFVIAIVGIAVICFSGEESIGFHLTGELISLGACFVWAVYGLFSEPINHKGFDVILVTRRLFFYGIVFTSPFYFVWGRPDAILAFARPVYLLNILYLGLFACAVSFITWNYAIGILGTVSTNVYVYFLPVVTIIMECLILREKLTICVVGGTVLVMAGLILSEWRGYRE